MATQPEKITGIDNPGFDFNSEKGVPKSQEKTGDAELAQPAAPQREQWSNPIEFLLSCISMSVGLGNIWRFPFVAYANGGGAFLIPYLIVLFFIGKPLYYLELCLGQFCSYGPVKIWEILPAFKGVGYAQILAACCTVTYYVSLMGLAIFYAFASFSSELPWARCSQNATNCFDPTTNTSEMNITSAVSSSEYFFVNEVLKKDPNGLDNGISTPDWKLALCLLAGWMLIFVVLVRGIKSSGKSAYFTALFPYVVLFTLLGRSATLPGASKGIKYFLTPQWDKLLDPTVWFAAVGQCFFSLSAGFGSIPMFASFNPFRHNINRDVNIISLVDTGTSFLAGVTIFAILGHLADLMNVDDISLVVKDGGTSLAFISYPDVIARFAYAPQVFSVLFFLMLLTLGVGSASALAGGVITTICDNFPDTNRTKITFIVCVLGFLLGLFYVTPQGDLILFLVDFYGASFLVYIFAFMMTIGIFWIYGHKNFTRDIEFMLNIKTHMYWKFCWIIFLPVALGCVFGYMLLTWSPLQNGSYVYGPIANGVGVAIVVVALLSMPICLLHFVSKEKKEGLSQMEAFRSSLRPTALWCPKNPVYAQEYLELLSAPGSSSYVLQSVAGAKKNPKDPSLSSYKNVS